MTQRQATKKMDTYENPIDRIEDHLISEEWPTHRMNPDELLIEIPGRWCDYRLQFVWHDELDVLQLYCILDLRVQPEHATEVNILLSIINEHMALGHFEVNEEEAMPIFRYGALLMSPQSLTMDYVDLLIGIAMAEAERFYPAFQFVLWGGKTAKEAAEVCMMDTVGEA